ncbi:protein of unknown function [Magnetospirillum sp. XM-1]|uniref:hypothetical protein n=1 Tax=Magnetospirillum sp. XM-1 TaxID=1663591 RepID=UPI00073DBCF5|nr:hypothetical protein [Magnetospirillum sp. XM-1]CUW39679.1 protein of unknown function [Magnetospirillum sp. XM-1]
MKVKVLRDTFASGELLRAGKVHDVADDDARVLIAMRKAEAFQGKEKPEKPAKGDSSGGAADGGPQQGGDGTLPLGQG